MIGRRAMLTSVAALAAAPARAALPMEDLTFQVLRDGSDIGRHTVRFEPAGADFLVRIAVDIKVGLGPITFFRYSLRATERWHDALLIGAAGDTNDDGTKDFVKVTRQGAGLAVAGSAGPAYTAAAPSICATHWNRAELAAPMVNIQNGELLTFAVTSKGKEQIKAQGRMISAEHYVLDGKNKLEIWYDDRNVWSALKAAGKDGSLIEYLRV